MSSLHQASLSSRRITQDLVAPGAGDDSLGVAKDRHNVEAALALDVHKERVGGLDQALLFVETLLRSRGRVQ